MPKRITLAAVNAELARRGCAERLYRGRGYFYFSDGSSHCWPQSAVYVARVGALSLEQWLATYVELRQGWEDTRA